MGVNVVHSFRLRRGRMCVVATILLRTRNVLNSHVPLCLRLFLSLSAPVLDRVVPRGRVPRQPSRRRVRRMAKLRLDHGLLRIQQTVRDTRGN